MRGRRFSILSVGVPVFAAATAVAAVIAFAQGLPDSSAPQLLPIAQPHMSRVAALLNGPRRRAPAVLAEAEAEARRALAASPARADAWLALAYIDRTRAGGLDTKAAAALDRSYLVGPLDPDLKAWRVQFCFDSWSSLPKALRDDALRELSALWSRWDMREDLNRLAGAIDDPAGRLAFRVQLAILQRGERQIAAAVDGG
jgi:hypothetical protein